MQGEKFIEELKVAIRNEVSRRAQELIEADPEKYFEGTRDYGYYDNGVGMACYGKEDVYNEDQAYEDAVQEIAVDIANGSKDFEIAQRLFIDNNKLTSALAELIKEI